MILKYKCLVRFEKKGLAIRKEQQKYREIASNIISGVLDSACCADIINDCRLNNIKGIEVNIMFTDDASIKTINKEYRGIDKSTDVLSFPVNDFTYGSGRVMQYNVDSSEKLLLMGDIVISLPTLMRQAEEYGHSDVRECAFLICHGMLHLFGYDHMNETDEKQMFGYADDILNKLSYIK